MVQQRRKNGQIQPKLGKPTYPLCQDWREIYKGTMECGGVVQARECSLEKRGRSDPSVLIYVFHYVGGDGNISVGER